MQQALLSIFLFLHVMGAIITFGPAFIGPLVARQVRRMPQGGHFAAVLGDALATRVVIPGAIVQGITGVALILLIGLNLTSPAWRWLDIAIVLYLVAISFSIFVQRKSAARMVEITRGLAGPSPPGSQGAPPPELLETAANLQRGSMLLWSLIVVIVFLMVVKPTL
jgi:hypothetical protein